MNNITEIHEKIGKIIFPHESNIEISYTKNNDLRIGYTNDYPMQHGNGQWFVIPKELVNYLIKIIENENTDTEN